MHVSSGASDSTAYGASTNGPTVEAGFKDGFLDVEALFNARAMFIGSTTDRRGASSRHGKSSHAVKRQPGFADIDMDQPQSIFQPNQSGTIHMMGSTARSRRESILARSGRANQNQLWFTADSRACDHFVERCRHHHTRLRVELDRLSVAPGEPVAGGRAPT